MTTRAPGLGALQHVAEHQFTSPSPATPRFPYGRSGNRPCRSDVAALSLDFPRPHGAPPYLELASGGRQDLARKLEELVDVDASLERGELVGRAAPEPACIFCSCTEDNACSVERVRRDASGGSPATVVEGCSWLSLDPPICDAPKCRELLAAAGGLEAIKLDPSLAAALAAVAEKPASTLDRLFDVLQLLEAGTKGPASNIILGGASYDAILEQLQLAVQEVAAMAEELDAIGDFSALPSPIENEPSLLDVVMARVDDNRRAAIEKAAVRDGIREQLEHEQDVDTESPYRESPQADGAR